MVPAVRVPGRRHSRRAAVPQTGQAITVRTRYETARWPLICGVPISLLPKKNELRRTPPVVVAGRGDFVVNSIVN